jgi:hypothetical protein
MCFNMMPGLHGVSFLTSVLASSFSASNFFPYPTGPTYSRIVAFAKPTHSRVGRFPSTLVLVVALVFLSGMTLLYQESGNCQVQ